MRKTGLIRTIAALIILAVAAPTLCLGENLKEAEALQRKIIEPYNAGKYRDALPVAQHLLSMREKALGPNHLALRLH